MDKLAQKRSLRSRVWENVNLTGKALEGMHEEFAAVMNKMREADQEIRSIAEDVKPLIRFAKSNVRQRDYLNAAHQITGFHARLKAISHILEKFSKNLEVGNYDYFLNDFSGPEQEELFGYDPEAAIKDACADFDDLVKEAGILDWIKDKSLSGKDITTDTASNIITDKGRSRRLLEKRFDAGFVKKIKTLTIDLVRKSEKMLRDLLSIFSDLESGVSRRNIKLYTAKAKEFVAKFKAYHKVYVYHRTEVVEPLKQHKAAKDAAEKEKAVKLKEEQQSAYENRDPQTYEDFNNKQVEENDRYEQQIKEQTPPAAPVAPPKPPLPGQPAPTKSPLNEMSFEEWKEQQPQSTISNEEANKELDKLEKKLGPVDVPKKAHTAFIKQLTAYANQDEVSSFVNELLDYSDKLENTDPTASANLLTVANNIINDYKTAGMWDFLKGKPVVSKPAESEELEAEAPTAVPEVKEKLRPGLQFLKKKPQELADEEARFLRPADLNLPTGRIDKAYTDVSILRNITPDKIRVTPETGKAIIRSFATRLAKVRQMASLEPYIRVVELKLIPAIKQAIYNGWVIQSDDVIDDYNPRDKYIEVYTRLNLAEIDETLSGAAKLYISCRVSADKGLLTVRKISKNFAIEAIQAPETMDEEIEDIENNNYEDQSDQYNED
jgi:hypothetical protein